MFNGFDNAAARAKGISGSLIRRALQCCLERTGPATYHVARPCGKHVQFAAFTDPDSLRIAASGRSGEARPDDVRRARRLRHLSACAHSALIVDDDVVACGSAALIHGLPLLLAAPPPVSTMPAQGGRGRFSRRGPDSAPGQTSTPWRSGEEIETWNPRHSRDQVGLVRRRSGTPEGQRLEWCGRAISSELWTVVDLSRTRSVCDGLVACDALLARSAPDAAADRRTDLLAVLDDAPRLRGIRSAKLVAEWATGLAENPAESMCLYVLRALGFGHSALSQQVDICDSGGAFIGRVDFLIVDRCDEPVIVEVDGAVKYLPEAAGGFAGNGAAPGLAAAKAVIREKEREDALRSAGYTVVRLSWRDLYRSRTAVAKLQSAGVRVSLDDWH